MTSLSSLAWIFAVVVVVYLTGFSFLLLVKPELFYKWFFRQRMDWWGLSIAITDKRRFASRCRIFGWLMVAATVAAFWVLFMLDGGVF